MTPDAPPSPLSRKRFDQILQATTADPPEHLPHWLRAGLALCDHWNMKRYADEGHDTFRDYCRGALGIHPQRAYLLIGAAQIARDLEKQTACYVPTEEEALALGGNQDYHAFFDAHVDAALEHHQPAPK